MSDETNRGNPLHHSETNACYTGSEPVFSKLHTEEKPCQNSLLMKSKQELLAALPHFTGTEYWYRHPLSPRHTYTDGVKFIAENAGAYWLLDVIVSYQMYPKVNTMPLQVWKLTRSGESSAIVTLEDGDGNEVKRQVIEYTDFPLDEFVIWMEGTVMLLPNEH